MSSSNVFCITSNPAARAKPPPHKRRIFQGKCSFITFQVIKHSYLKPLNMFSFGHATSKTRIRMAGVVSVTKLDEEG